MLSLLSSIATLPTSSQADDLAHVLSGRRPLATCSDLDMDRHLAISENANDVTDFVTLLPYFVTWSKWLILLRISAMGDNLCHIGLKYDNG